MALELHTYDPLQIVIVFKGLRIQGYADGTYVKVSRSVDTWADQVGADGQMTRVRTRDQSGTITLTLVAASQSNKDLALLALEDEQFGNGVGTASIRDLNGLDLHKGESGWIKKPPEAEYGKDAGTREWVIRVQKLETFSGGSVL